MRMSVAFWIWLRQSRPWTSGSIHRETRGRPPGTAADPEMAEGRSLGGWGVVGDEGGDSASGEISPLLANIYLHYVLDQWVTEWRYAAGNRQREGKRKPETFNSLGFTHNPRHPRLAASRSAGLLQLPRCAGKLLPVAVVSAGCDSAPVAGGAAAGAAVSPSCRV